MIEKRYQTKESAQVEVYGHIGVVGARLRNLSKSGAFLEFLSGQYVPQRGDLLNLTVKLDSLQKTYNLSAEVVWSKGLGMGICFINKNHVLERMMIKSNGI